MREEGSQRCWNWRWVFIQSLLSWENRVFIHYTTFIAVKSTELKIEHLKKEIVSKTKTLNNAGDECGGLRKELEAAQKEAAALLAQLKSLGCDDAKEEQLIKVCDRICDVVWCGVVNSTIAHAVCTGQAWRGDFDKGSAGECRCSLCQTGWSQIRVFGSHRRLWSQQSQRSGIPPYQIEGRPCRNRFGSDCGWQVVQCKLPVVVVSASKY